MRALLGVLDRAGIVSAWSGQSALMEDGGQDFAGVGELDTVRSGEEGVKDLRQVQLHRSGGRVRDARDVLPAGRDPLDP